MRGLQPVEAEVLEWVHGCPPDRPPSVEEWVAALQLYALGRIHGPDIVPRCSSCGRTHTAPTSEGRQALAIHRAISSGVIS